ncbi:hypothetical protein LTSEGIV_5457, partial [Salmonella enterica subsp. enterica serovar Give str. S5-487]
ETSALPDGAQRHQAARLPDDGLQGDQKEITTIPRCE